MNTIYISVNTEDYSTFGFGYFEDTVTAIPTAAAWVARLKARFPDQEIEFFSKKCVAADEALADRLSEWIGRKNLDQTLVVPFITREGYELDLLKRIGAGWILTNQYNDAVRTASELPAEFLLSCLQCNDTPEGCPLGELAKAVENLSDNK